MKNCWRCSSAGRSRERRRAVDVIPLFPLNVVLFPGGPLPLRIFETRYLDMVRTCMRNSTGFGVVLIRTGGEVGPAETYDVGTMTRIVDFHQLQDGLLGLSCVGEQRFRIHSRRRQGDGLHIGEVEHIAAEVPVPVPAQHQSLADLLQSVLPQLGESYTGIEMHLDDAVWVGHRLAEILPMPPADKQQCLELIDPLRRLEVLAPMVSYAERADG